MRSTLVSVSLTLLAFAGFALSADADAWRTRSVYQIMTDRFARPDGSTTAPCNTTAADYCGGTWRGIIDKLDYIQGMGFTAVWISPITAQINQTTPYGQAYTGYWQNDMYAINDIWGTTEDLKDLAKALHDRDMYFMVDTIVNNFAYDGPGNSVNYALYNPFNNKEYFHNFCLIQNYSIYEDATQCWMGDNTVSLPDLRTEDPDVVKMFQEWIPGFVQNFSIDGLRIDAVKQVDRQFFPYLLEAAGGLYAVGEEYEGDTNVACEYQNYMPGITNYPAYFPALRAFQNSSGSMDDLAKAITDVSQICGDSTLLGSFSENHDVPRFASYTQDLSLAKNILAFTILQDGIPLIYQGQEQHYDGGNNPSNREAIWLSGFNTGSPMYEMTAALNRIRNHAIMVDADYITYKTQPLYTDDNTLAMMKGYVGKQVVTVLSNKGAASQPYEVNLPVGFSPGEEVIDLIGCQRYNISGIGELKFQITSGLPMAFYGVNNMAGVKLCGDNGLGGPEGVKAGTAKNTTNGSNPTANSGVQISVNAFSWLFVVALGFILFR